MQRITHRAVCIDCKQKRKLEAVAWNTEDAEGVSAARGAIRRLRARFCAALLVASIARYLISVSSAGTWVAQNVVALFQTLGVIRADAQEHGSAVRSDCRGTRDERDGDKNAEASENGLLCSANGRILEPR